MKNTQQREGFLNRHTHPLPTHVSTMIIKYVENVEHVYLCKWEPFDKTKYTEKDMPPEGYVGTATVIEGTYAGIGFHAWEQFNSEFIYYKLV